MKYKQRILIFTIGLPRSGKTTVVNQLRGRFEQFIKISADDLRWLVYGHKFFSCGEDYVWAARKTMLRYLLSQGFPVIVDETNTTKERRNDIIKYCRYEDYKVWGLFVNTSKETCIQRIYDEDTIEEVSLIKATERMSDQLNKYMYLSEGIDRLYEINEKENEINSLIDNLQTEIFK
jgi:predicted kinase